MYLIRFLAMKAFTSFVTVPIKESRPKTKITTQIASELSFRKDGVALAPISARLKFE